MAREERGGEPLPHYPDLRALYQFVCTLSAAKRSNFPMSAFEICYFFIGCCQLQTTIMPQSETYEIVIISYNSQLKTLTIKNYLFIGVLEFFKINFERQSFSIGQVKV